MQRYKICQQFTTLYKLVSANAYCFRYAKIQNLSAIHNFDLNHLLPNRLFQICKDTKFVSNSQQSPTTKKFIRDCFRYAKIQNLSAIHNTLPRTSSPQMIVSDMQRYKICQQFTTYGGNNKKFLNCFRYAKIQNLSAIHNLS